MQTVLALTLVFTLLGAILFLLRRRGIAQFRLPQLHKGSAAPRRLEVLERIALNPQHSLYLVRVGGRSVLIATAPGSCRILENTVEI